MHKQFVPLLSKLNLKFTNPDLLKEAFTHRSYLNEVHDKNVKSNERLEFLGDAILSFIITFHLFKTYPYHPEGLLTNLRSTIVKTETLADIAKELDFGSFLLLSKGEEKSGGRSNLSLLADVFEAFISALFLDQGISRVERFLQIHLLPKITDIVQKQLYTDYKSRLQEIVQEFSKSPPTYEVVKTEGPDHAKFFWVRVIIDSVKHEMGTGKSKQEAEQAAAAKTLEKMGKI